MSLPIIEQLIQRIEKLEGNLGETIVDYTFDNSTTNEIEFDLDLNPGEKLEITINGGVTADTDIKVQFNDIITNTYKQFGYGFNSNKTGGDGSLGSGSRTQTHFYYAIRLFKNEGIIKGSVYLINANTFRKYYPFFHWKSISTLPETYYIGEASGTLQTDIDKISKIKFGMVNTGVCFKEGTNIKIKKRKDN